MVTDVEHWTQPTPEEQRPDGGHHAKSAGPAAAEGRRALRVLLVEDDRSTRAALRRILAYAGHDVRAVETLAEGLTELAWPPDCVVLDLMLPDGCGLTVLRRVRDAG